MKEDGEGGNERGERRWRERESEREREREGERERNYVIIVDDRHGDSGRKGRGITRESTWRNTITQRLNVIKSPVYHER